MREQQLAQGHQSRTGASTKKKHQATLNFNDGEARFARTALEEIREKPEEGLNFYSFNPRMIPDNVHSRPVFRKLAPRTQEDIEMH